MNIKRTEAYLSEGGTICKSEMDAIRTSYRERIDKWIAPKIPGPHASDAQNFIYFNIDELANILRGYPEKAA